jgi:nucleotide-binding universal stress UspA family protein
VAAITVRDSGKQSNLERDRSSPRFELGASAREAGVGARRVIVLATSGSRSAIEATVFAAELAVAFNAALRIVHVVPPIEYKVGRLAPMRPVQRKLTDPFESLVLRQARELAWRHGAAATLQLLSGEPPRAIVAAAASNHADLLVIGARNHDTAFLCAKRRRAAGYKLTRRARSSPRTPQRGSSITPTPNHPSPVVLHSFTGRLPRP